jgi:hypothetical protein
MWRFQIHTKGRFHRGDAEARRTAERGFVFEIESIPTKGREYFHKRRFYKFHLFFSVPPW